MGKIDARSYPRASEGGKNTLGDLERVRNLITGELVFVWIFSWALSYPLSLLSCATTHVVGRSGILMFICRIKKPRPIEVN